MQNAIYSKSFHFAKKGKIITCLFLQKTHFSKMVLNQCKMTFTTLSLTMLCCSHCKYGLSLGVILSLHLWIFIHHTSF